MTSHCPYHDIYIEGGNEGRPFWFKEVLPCMKMLEGITAWGCTEGTLPTLCWKGATKMQKGRHTHCTLTTWTLLFSAQKGHQLWIPTSLRLRGRKESQNSWDMRSPASSFMHVENAKCHLKRIFSSSKTLKPIQHTGWPVWDLWGSRLGQEERRSLGPKSVPHSLTTRRIKGRMMTREILDQVVRKRCQNSPPLFNFQRWK